MTTAPAPDAPPQPKACRYVWPYQWIPDHAHACIFIEGVDHARHVCTCGLSLGRAPWEQQ